MKMMKHIQTWLLITLLALSASGVANAKLASGHQNLSGNLHQSQTVLNALLHQGLSEVSTTETSGSPLATKGTTGGLVNTTKAVLRQKAGFSDKGKPIILDSNLETKGLADALRSQGFNVRSVSEIFGKDVGDPAINRLANQLGARVLTRDRGRQIGEGFGSNAINVNSRVRGTDGISRILGDGL